MNFSGDAESGTLVFLTRVVGGTDSSCDVLRDCEPTGSIVGVKQ
jgi:hypothetical protein